MLFHSFLHCAPVLSSIRKNPRKVCIFIMNESHLSSSSEISLPQFAVRHQFSNLESNENACFQFCITINKYA